ncbi:hypothetical protein [Reichenbachiella sp. MSK19-1]|uniref:hypothetical protein n=1 Tax=Reichenbachiella sp. MSK19-1 TaxID=1897631 RepID=UPI000E6C6883|nr:hypothetical protein [Reichenbachiella sp. MSK19-1]RJE74981.1 hypothetical protein BGP76_17840 [Reichenbachiella sp. MSK19-1]
MNKKELQTKLDLLGVASQAYSLEGELVPDNIILYNSYHKWEVFYLDERGGRNDEKEFDSESEACEHIYKLFKESQAIEDKYLK